MLTLLEIKDFAVIDELSLTFDAGLTAITGETGSGKSLLLEAVHLALGARLSGPVVRQGAEALQITAVFDLQGRPLQVQDEMVDELVLSRTISAAGRSLFRLNGALVTAAQIRELAPALSEFLTQGQSGRLVAGEYQRQLLDRFGRLEADLEAVTAAREEVARLERLRTRLGGDTQSRARHIDLLRYQVGEIERSGVEAGEDETLAEKRQLLRRQERLMLALAQAHQAISGDEGTGAYDFLAGAIAGLEDAGAGIASFERWVDKAQSLLLELDELGKDLHALEDAIGEAEGSLDDVEARLRVLEDLKHKYGPGLQDVLRFAEEAAAQLEDLEGAEERSVEVEAELGRATGRVEEAVAALQEHRRAVAPEFARLVCQELAHLGLEKAAFTVEVGDQERDVAFVFQPNPGEKPQRLGDIASGGELSRLNLALKTVAPQDDPAVLLLDEVDAGMGGDAARLLAQRLRHLSRGRQVIVVTHQATVAARAQAHFFVEKRVVDGRTSVTVRKLDEQGKIDELGRMLSGSTEGIERQHAKALLAQNRNET